VDVYLPDMKYIDSRLSAEYSKAPDYADVAKAAIHEMVRQTGKPEFFIEDDELVKSGIVEAGIMKKGVIVRHLVLPGTTKDSKAVIKYLLDTYGEDVRTKARAYAAAGSDARMSGCELPVVINSGSGNQGITVSVPVIIYAKEYHKSDEELLRALLVSNLIAIHIKTGIGPLSAFCGAVSAGCAAGCAIAFLLGGGIDEVAHTLVNSIAITSGIICDGAKPSCAAKIASSVDAGILGYEMYRHGQQFYGEDGIVSKGVENTIRNICRIGAEGMNGTDEEIIKIMTHCD